MNFLLQFLTLLVVVGCNASVTAFSPSPKATYKVGHFVPSWSIQMRMSTEKKPGDTEPAAGTFYDDEVSLSPAEKIYLHRGSHDLTPLWGFC